VHSIKGKDHVFRSGLPLQCYAIQRWFGKMPGKREKDRLKGGRINRSEKRDAETEVPDNRKGSAVFGKKKQAAV